MRHFTIVFTSDASRDLDRLLAEGRAPGLEDAVGKALARLEQFPESGGPDRIRGGWSLTRRRVILGRTGYILRYRLHLKAELIEVRSVRHEKQRPPRR
jgi:plasmid stabilization system protein ParE